MNEQAAEATRKELAQGAREHYNAVSREACCYSSTIPKAIDAWEVAPDLWALVEAVREREEASMLADTAPNGPLLGTAMARLQWAEEAVRAALARLDGLEEKTDAAE